MNRDENDDVDSHDSLEIIDIDSIEASTKDDETW
jgi:hypothetical protein